ncbi:MAG TPA: MFS transporter, partial [Elusimicrobiales bacterium]|nr:MFS transporter [Elusimicrobiales bacterium]
MKVPAGFWILSFGEAVLTAGYAVSFPFLAVYLSGHRHIPMSLVGLFLALSLFMTSFAHVIGGELADVFGRKKIMVSALFTRAVLIGAIAWVIKADGDILLLLALHPLGLFVGSFYSPAARAWVADSTPPERRMKVYGILRIGTNAGWAVGPAVGGLMAAGSYPVMFGFTALVYLVCALVLTLFIK